MKQNTQSRSVIGRNREGIIFLVVFFAIFGYLAHRMGLANMLNTMMNTSFKLLLYTVFYIMGITVLSGALARLLTEFGVVRMLERLLRPLMRPLFNLPGVAALGGVITFLSDNPAIITLAKDGKFARYFRKYQLISLTNFGTAFGMGLVVIVFMIGQGFIAAPFLGLFGACCGCVISTRLMQRFVLRSNPELDAPASDEAADHAETEDEASKEGTFLRVLNALLDGGKSGVDLGLAIIPGVLIISTFVMMFTFDTTTFTGEAFEGVGLLPWLADKISFVFEWGFGFTDSRLVAFPITALGAVGAALGLVPTFNASGLLDANAVAVFTAMGMCWSGYLSTHTAMLDTMGYRALTSKAILAHTIGGFCAGVIAHWSYVLVTWIATLGGGEAPHVNYATPQGRVKAVVCSFDAAAPEAAADFAAAIEEEAPSLFTYAPDEAFDAAAELPQYARVTIAATGEALPFYYYRDRFEPADAGRFALSGTADGGEASWVILTERSSGKSFWCCNARTGGDPTLRAEEIRTLALQLRARLIADDVPQGPTIESDSPVFDPLTDIMRYVERSVAVAERISGTIAADRPAAALLLLDGKLFYRGAQESVTYDIAGEEETEEATRSGLPCVVELAL